MADIVDRDVVVLAPKKWHGGELVAVPKHVERGGLALALGDDPMLDANTLLAMGVGPARDVASRKDPGHAGFEVGVHDHPAVERKAGCFRKRRAWTHPDAGDDEIGIEHAAALQGHPLAVDGARRVLEAEDHALLPMERAHEVAHLRTEDAFHRPLFRRHHMDFDPARAQRRGDFEPDEARSQHNSAAGRLGALDDGAAVGARAQRVDVWLVGAWDRQPDRLGAGRQQQPVVGDPAPAGKQDFMRARVDAGDIRAQSQLDAVLGIEAVRAQRHPILGRLAGEIVLGEIRPVDRGRSIIAQHDDAALVFPTTQHLGGCEAGRPAAKDHDPPRQPCRRFAAPWLRHLFLMSHEDFSLALLDHPTRKRVECRRVQGLPGAQIKAGVVPGAPHRIVDNEPLDERSMIMGAGRAEGEDVSPTTHQQDILVADMADELASVGKRGERNSLRQIGAAWLRRVLSHDLSNPGPS